MRYQLLRGFLIIFLGNIVASFLNYLYHLITGRLLPPPQYGLLESFIAVIYLLGVINQAFSFTIIKLMAQAKNSTVTLGVVKLEKLILKFSFLFWFIFLFSFPVFRSFLHFSNFLIFFIFSLQVLFSFLPTIYLAALQAKLKFLQFSLIAIAASCIKIIFACGFILLGWQMQGALMGWLGWSLAVIFLGKIVVKNLWPIETAQSSLKFNFRQNFWTYSHLTFLTNLPLVLIYSLDIFLVRHFFSPYNSGIYSAASVLGKINFFAASSILLVAFPLFIKYKNKNIKLRQTFNYSFLFITLICLIGTVFYQLKPILIVKLLYGNNYLDAASFLFNFAIFMSLYALFNLFIQFLLAMEKKLAAQIAWLTVFLQIILIIARHNDLNIVVINSIIALCLGLLFASISVIKVINEKKR